jgi:hypothetical protein
MHLQKTDVIGYLFVPYLADSYVLRGPACAPCLWPEPAPSEGREAGF